MKQTTYLPTLTLILHDLKKYHTIIKQFFTYAFTIMFTRGLSILCAPITMQILTPADYGLLALANSFISIATVFLGLGLRQMLPLIYFEQEKHGRKQLINDLLCIYLLITVPIFAIILIKLPFINHLMFVGQAPSLLLMVSLFISFIYFFVELFYQLLQYQQQAWQLTKIQVSIALLTIACNLLFLCWFELGPVSLLLGQAIGMLLLCVVGLKAYRAKNFLPYLQIKRSIKNMRSYLLLG